MEHIAIDLGGRESQICIRNSEGAILEERKYPTASLERYLKKRPPSRVVLETSAEAFAVADGALRCGHEVRVVPATLAPSLGVGSRKTKNDQKDARILSEVSSRIDLPSVHVPSGVARERRARCTAREAMVKARTVTINSSRGYMRTQLGQVRSGGVETFPKRAREKLLELPTGIPEFLERMLTAIEALTEQINAADLELLALAKADETCQRLMTVPGVGPVTAMRFVAAVDVIDRFPAAHKLTAYLGLTPGEDSSSTRERRTSITKAGPAAVRRTLVQASWCLLRCRPEEPIVKWAKEIAGRRGKRIAVVALSRKLAGILFAMWRDGSSYKPADAARTKEEKIG